MSKNDIKITGIEDINERLMELTDIEKYRRAIGKACALVERSAKTGAPKGDGALRNSIKSTVEVDANAVVGTVFTPLEYAPYVEYGTGLFAESGGRKDVPWHYQDDKGEWHTTSGMKPHPYMRPALNENREKIIRLLKEAAKDD